MTDKRKIVSAVGSAAGTSHVVAVPAATFVPTTRQIDGGDQCWSQVQEWAMLEDNQQLASDPLSLTLSEVLANTQPFPAGELRCFRGVAFPEGLVPEPSNMGPPPDRRMAAPGRYNAEGHRVLYLSGSLDGVTREVKPGLNNTWLQSYTLRCDRLRIADFRPPVKPLVNHVFWWTETASEDRGTRFLFSQFVADLVEQFFDGMIVPGVRGDGSLQYFNVVVFRPNEYWRDWLTEGSMPKRLSA
ncbi:MAG: RES family NAD+ phosphorylase [Blastocatellia bacterium]